MAMDKESILEELGFSRNEAKIYLALLQIGASTVTSISNRIKINRSNIYDCLDKLVEKGVVSYFMKKDAKLFEAEDPQVLVHLVRERERKLNAILPELKLHKDMVPKKSQAHIFEGIVAVRHVFNHMLDKNEPRLAYGASNDVADMLGKHFLQSYHRKRVQKKIPFKLIYNSNARARRKVLNRMPHTESRYLPKEYDSPVTTNICGDEVIFIVYAENPMTIQIKNDVVAQAYKKYFDLLWSLARK